MSDEGAAIAAENAETMALGELMRKMLTEEECYAHLIGKSGLCVDGTVDLDSDEAELVRKVMADDNTSIEGPPV